MELKVIGINDNGIIEFEQIITLPCNLCYNFTIDKRLVYTQLQLTNGAIINHLIVDLKKWDIDYEMTGSLIIFKKDGKECPIFLGEKTDKPLMESMAYFKMLSDHVLNQLLCPKAGK